MVKGMEEARPEKSRKYATRLLLIVAYCTRSSPLVSIKPVSPNPTNKPLGSFAPFPFTVPAVFDLDFENFRACIIGDGKAPISLRVSPSNICLILKAIALSDSMLVPLHSPSPLYRTQGRQQMQLSE
jgi:hypothetical protein